MEQEYRINGSKMIYDMPKEVDHHQATRMIQQIDRLIAMHRIQTLVFNFKGTEFMDSSGIGVLIGRSRTMHFYGGKVKAANLSGRAELIFRASGLGQIIEVVKEEEHE